MRVGYMEGLVARHKYVEGFEPGGLYDGMGVEDRLCVLGFGLESFQRPGMKVMVRIRK